LSLNVTIARHIVGITLFFFPRVARAFQLFSNSSCSDFHYAI